MRAAKAREKEIRQIALERMEILFSQAEKEFRAGRRDLANRYVEIARAIGMKVNLPIPSHLKRWFCKRCHAFLMPGVNAKVRLKEGCVVTTCGVCGAEMRIPYQPKAVKLPTA